MVIAEEIYNIILYVLLSMNLATVNVENKMEEIHCGSLNIYHEARGESNYGQLAVAHVVNNRVKSNLFPSSVCGVILEDKQFSWVSDDISDLPNLDSRRDRESFYKSIWFHVTSDSYEDITDGALWYYAHNKVTPKWAAKKIITARIGNHTFLK